ncbi:hypothetical protein [Novipirellula rosea]|uniref:Secreted protein n=1 Tax=Novipirellula rosea TaxID=1031540 RepID=A0ABP8MG69_9BACT|tara:strand:+ start:3477 stop:3938 length:462 start_codon:yes stop_codon:yes gene_type:complete
MDFSTIIASVAKKLLLLALLVGLAPTTGCRICAECEDLAYPAYGGAWQRTRRDGGRVGSIFDPAGARTPELVNRDLPLSPDEKERAKRSGDEDRPLEETDGISPEPDSMNLDNEDSDRDQYDQEMQRKEKELRDLDLDEIRILRGSPEPLTGA